jgi:hypothetical protein
MIVLTAQHNSRAKSLECLKCAELAERRRSLELTLLFFASLDERYEREA